MLANRPRIYYGWVNLAVAAAAMTATLPGRTHGLGLITTPLTSDATLGIDDERFGQLNFLAILIGAAMCLPVGRLIDRFGTRVVLTFVSLGLGGAVLWMSTATDATTLFIASVLVRGLGQGSLSIVSMAMVGKWFTRRLGLAMGVFTILLSFGFILGNYLLGTAVEERGWREAWAQTGWVLVGLAGVGWLVSRSTPESVGLTVEAAPAQNDGRRDLPLIAALMSPGFWAFTAAASLFNFTWSAITLYNESILGELGFDRETYRRSMGVLVLAGLPSNFLAGWLLNRWPMGRLAFVGMAVFAASLFALPHVRTESQLIIYTAALGVAGGIVTVLFFAVNGRAFGRTNLGAIQATAQVASVFASALGPLVLIVWKRETGSYMGLFTWTAPVALLVGVAAWRLKFPSRSD